MKKLNNKGFLLVETVIVSVFVLTIFVLVYQNSLPMIEEYNQRIRYDDMDTVYDVDLFRRLIMDDPNTNSFFEEVDSVGYKDMTSCTLYSPEQQSVCQKLKEYVGVGSDQRIYLTVWDITVLDSLSTLPRGFLEYTKYIKKQDQEKIAEYRLVLSRTHKYEVQEYENNHVVTKTKEENHYANIGIANVKA